MNLLDFLKENNIPTAPEGHHHVNSSEWIGVDCPFCSPNSKRFRLGLHKTGRGASCWTCGPHKSIETLAILTGNKPSVLYGILGHLDHFNARKAHSRGLLKVPKGVGPLLPVHQAYLQSRGFDPETIQRLWDIQGIGIAPRYSWRLFIPVSFEGEVVSFTTRAITNETKLPRYQSADAEDEVWPIKSLLYGEFYVRHAVIIVEGPTDCWRVGPGAVATMGTQFTRAQLLKLSKYPVRVVCYDKEPEAQQQARRLADAMAIFPGTTVNVTLDADDPGSATEEEIKELRNRFLGE